VNPVAAIILSAGESRRMGTPKALLQFRGQTFIEGLIARLQVHCAPVVVVLGHDAERIRCEMGPAAQVVVNRNYTLGMLTSLQCGLRALPEQVSYAVFTLVDHPDPAGATIAAVVNAPPAPVVIPRFEGRKGHPVRLSRVVIEELLALPPGAKPTDVLYRHVDATRFLDTADPGVVDDIDDRAAYDELMARSGESDPTPILSRDRKGAVVDP
jgi:molybdenum cofactor cytidylyltransferase